MDIVELATEGQQIVWNCLYFVTSLTSLSYLFWSIGREEPNHDDRPVSDSRSVHPRKAR